MYVLEMTLLHKKIKKKMDKQLESFLKVEICYYIVGINT